MVKTHAIAALVGLLIGLGLMWYIQSGRVDAANMRTRIEQQKTANAQADLSECQAAAAIQNQAIEDLRKRAEAAEAAYAQAQAQRAAHDTKADEIMQERTPEGANVCDAARDAFAEELRKERAK